MTITTPVLEVPHGGADYLELVRLRDLHLRQPIGLRLNPEDIVGEEAHRHFVLKDEGTITGGLIAVPLEPKTAKLRQMWILPELRCQGHGRYLLDTVERALWLEGYRHFVLHARQNAVGFYAECGYETIGDVFTEVGRPHLKMEKWW